MAADISVDVTVDLPVDAAAVLEAEGNVTADGDGALDQARDFDEWPAKYAGWPMPAMP